MMVCDDWDAGELMIPEEVYKQALLIRRTEDAFLNLFGKGKMNGTVHTCNGQEFSALSFCNNLQENDFIFSNHRCHGHYLAHTQDVQGLLAELMGKHSGVCGGIGSSQHLCNKNFYSNGIQGGIVPVAAGMAMAAKKNNSGSVGLVFIGDGTLGQGVVYETMNLASLLNLPLLIVCENNGYAQSTKRSHNLAGNIIDRARAFDIKTFQSNTWAVKELFENAQASIDFVRSGDGPAFHLVDTYRLNPHSKSDDFRCEKEVQEYAVRDPLNRFRDLNKDSYNQMLSVIDNEIDELIKAIDAHPPLQNHEYYDYAEKRTIADKYIPLEKIGDRVINRINQFFHEVIEIDKKVIFIGEDVLSPYGGAFKAAKDLSEKYPDNVVSTPISEQAITGMANGLALGGYKPYLEIMFGDFITLSFDQIVNHSSKFYHMYNKKVECPVVIRTPMGGGRGYGPTHSQTLDKHLAGIDNVKLIAINSFCDPKLIYENIYNNERHPVVVIENKIDYGSIVGEKTLTNYKVERTSKGYPVVACRPESVKPNLTIVTYGGIASNVFDALLEIFIETEYVSELIILSCLSPLDISPVVDSVSNTGNLVVIEEGASDFGIAGEIIASVVEVVGAQNIDKIKRIGALPVPIPSARSLEEHVLPNKSVAQQVIKGLI